MNGLGLRLLLGGIRLVYEYDITGEYNVCICFPFDLLCFCLAQVSAASFHQPTARSSLRSQSRLSQHAEPKWGRDVLRPFSNHGCTQRVSRARRSYWFSSSSSNVGLRSSGLIFSLSRFMTSLILANLKWFLLLAARPHSIQMYGLASMYCRWPTS